MASCFQEGAAVNPVEIGAPAPDLTLISSDGTRRHLVGAHDGLTVLYLMRAWT